MSLLGVRSMMVSGEVTTKPGTRIDMNPDVFCVIRTSRARCGHHLDQHHREIGPETCMERLTTRPLHQKANDQRSSQIDRLLGRCHHCRRLGGNGLAGLLRMKCNPGQPDDAGTSSGLGGLWCAALQGFVSKRRLPSLDRVAQE